MEYGSIERELQIDATPEVVFEVISTPEYIREWWDLHTDSDWTGVGELSWRNEDGVEHHRTWFTVVETDPPRRFAFRWTHGEDEIAATGNSMLVTFDLLPAGDGTTLRFSEQGFRERGWEAGVLEAQYNDHVHGWDFYLPRLAALAGRLAATR
ncbi:MAG TPA: SRPBCC domain-containing protein [Jatrophihabitantaceae bacterium]|nr:SRPBCC domain-containing protein [Jatrophihabitantaceae bacterium]